MLLCPLHSQHAYSPVVDSSRTYPLQFLVYCNWPPWRAGSGRPFPQLVFRRRLCICAQLRSKHTSSPVVDLSSTYLLQVFQCFKLPPWRAGSRGQFPQLVLKQRFWALLSSAYIMRQTYIRIIEQLLTECTCVLKMGSILSIIKCNNVMQTKEDADKFVLKLICQLIAY